MAELVQGILKAASRFSHYSVESVRALRVASDDKTRGCSQSKSKVKRSILIGSLSGRNFAIGAAKTDRSRTESALICVLEKKIKRKHFDIK